MTKLIYLGCLSKEKYQDTCINAIKIIQKLDPEYKEIDDAPCCGSLLFHTSTEEEIKNHVQKVHNWFNSNEVSDIITICAGCYRYLTTEHKEYFPEFDINIEHFVEYIAQPENLEKLDLKYEEGKKLVVTYHDPCHLKSVKPKIIEEPRKILESVKGSLVFKEMDPNPILSLCCGAGGGVYSSFKENSAVNSPIIFENAKKSRAKLLLTSCPFCFTALKKAKEENSKIRMDVMKYEDFIMKLIEGVDPLA